MRKREIIKKNTELQKSLFAQFIVIYGIMCGMAAVSYLAVFSQGETPKASDLQSIFVNAFVPTTITVFATALFEYDFVRIDKTVSAIFILLTVTMSLLYVAFVYLEMLHGPTIITWISALAASIVTFLSFNYLRGKVKGLNQTQAKKNPLVSDGSISAIRRK